MTTTSKKAVREIEQVDYQRYREKERQWTFDCGIGSQWWILGCCWAPWDEKGPFLQKEASVQ
jgi:hypothetical protein